MARKPNFVHKKKRQRHGSAFWDQEYKNPEHLALSTEPGEDLVKFMRWLARFDGDSAPMTAGTAVDFGCGNGRHLIYLAREFGLTGIGYDQSRTAIEQAKQLSRDLPLRYTARSIAGSFDLPDASAVLALDMMTSHYLTRDERATLRDEIHRILAPGGFFFMKTFLRDGDLHSERLIKESPGAEPNSYIHPVIGVAEYVYSEDELIPFIREQFIVHKVYRSHKHARHGEARKRRTITVYAQKDPYR
jgi:SAM-dependent methyltransferase